MTNEGIDCGPYIIDPPPHDKNYFNSHLIAVNNYFSTVSHNAFGIDLDKCFDEVQNSNMSKLDENGKPIYNESGKVMKGPNYFKPDLSKFMN